MHPQRERLRILREMREVSDRFLASVDANDAIAAAAAVVEAAALRTEADDGYAHDITAHTLEIERSVRALATAVNIDEARAELREAMLTSNYVDSPEFKDREGSSRSSAGACGR